ncbi:hypothetical protein HRbin39_00894 [bacterium HR39]|nr:hypothetical protein HRbin39_00894 [bacterium HR39]
MVADGHHRNDLLIVEEDRQRPLVHHVHLHRPALVVDAAHRTRQTRVVGIRQERQARCGGLPHGGILPRGRG